MIYIPVFADENENEIEEHFPYTTDIIFLLSSITEEKAKELYVEEKQQIIKTPPFISGVFFLSIGLNKRVLMKILF